MFDLIGLPMTWPWIIVFGLIAFCAFINIMLVLSIKKLERADELLDVIDGGAAMLSGPDYAARAQWAAANDFEPDMVADFHGAVGAGPIRIGVWKNAYKKTFLSTYSTPEKIICEFVTILEKDSGLTTSNTKDSVLFPSAPGVFIQAFDGMELDELSKKHEAALVHLHQGRGLTIVERWESTDVLVLDSIRRQVAYVKSILLWQFRGAYWFLIRRSRINNKTIAEQYPA
jgi:hypothetical protein